MHVVENESVQSMIYRIHRLHGISDFSNIVDSTGRWVGFPRIKKGTLPIYQKIGERFILSMLQRQFLVTEQNGRFDDPAPYRKELNYLFIQSGKAKRIANFPIRYCIRCMQQDLAEKGFCFFNVEWTSSEYCKEHNKRLHQIPVISRANTISNLEMLFRGELPTDYEVVNNDNRKYHSNRRLVQRKKKLYFARCLQDDFFEYIKKERFCFHQDISDLFRFSLSGSHISESFLNTKKIDIFEALRKRQSSFIKRFISMYPVKVEKVVTGVLESSNLTEHYAKSDGEDCLLCSHTQCSLNRHIIRTRKVALSRICDVARANMISSIAMKSECSHDEAEHIFEKMNQQEKKLLSHTELFWLPDIYTLPLEVVRFKRWMASGFGAYSNNSRP